MAFEFNLVQLPHHCPLLLQAAGTCHAQIKGGEKANHDELEIGSLEFPRADADLFRNSNPNKAASVAIVDRATYVSSFSSRFG